MDPIIIAIPGEAVAKGRAKHRHVKTKDGREFNTTYTPAKTRQYEGIVRTRGELAMKGRPPLSMPLHVAVVIRVRPPQSWPQWKRDAALRGDIAPDSKPDTDNVKKAVYDGLNGVVWADDCQVCDGAWKKVYHEKPGVYLKVTALAKASCRITRRDQLAQAGHALERDTKPYVHPSHVPPAPADEDPLDIGRTYNRSVE